jgi:hypothetical protein
MSTVDLLHVQMFTGDEKLFPSIRLVYPHSHHNVSDELVCIMLCVAIGRCSFEEAAQ